MKVVNIFKEKVDRVDSQPLAPGLLDHREIAVPYFGDVIAADFQGDTLCVWTEARGTTPSKLSVYVLPTSPDRVELPDHVHHVASLQQLSGNPIIPVLVLHVYAGITLS